MTIPNPLSLDPEEQKLLADFEAGELRSLATPALLSQLLQAAKAKGLKGQRANILDSSDDFQVISSAACFRSL